MKRILLVEPPYKNKYPPLGLMKLSAYHKLKGDYVQFIKGCDSRLAKKRWDRIYISSLFTFYWNITVKTIKFYYDSVPNHSNIIVGGVMATLMGDELEQETGVTVIRGLLNKPGILDKNNSRIIDEMIPDYDLLGETDYDYGLKDCYFTYATRGCPNRCGFCAVNRIEPIYVHYLPLKKQIMGIDEVYGPKRNLILMDNNVLASSKYNQIINDIIELGFHRGSKFNGRKRIVDFNQGTDARLLSPEKMALLAKTAIEPLRIAFDNIAIKDVYVSKIKLARDHGILDLSNYVLYNYKDTPRDFYQRLKINVMLNERIGTKIYSFPMKYMPLNAKDRSFIGEHWNKRMLRGIQCVLLATRGLISPRREFFEAAFGSSYEEFVKIIYMPEEYIIYRRKHENNGAFDWRKNFEKLTAHDKKILVQVIANNKPVHKSMLKDISSKRIKNVLEHYVS